MYGLTCTYLYMLNDDGDDDDDDNDDHYDDGLLMIRDSDPNLITFLQNVLFPSLAQFSRHSHPHSFANFEEKKNRDKMMSEQKPPEEKG